MQKSALPWPGITWDGTDGMGGSVFLVDSHPIEERIPVWNSWCGAVLVENSMVLVRLFVVRCGVAPQPTLVAPSEVLPAPLTLFTAVVFNQLLASLLATVWKLDFSGKPNY